MKFERLFLLLLLLQGMRESDIISALNKETKDTKSTDRKLDRND